MSARIRPSASTERTLVDDKRTAVMAIGKQTNGASVMLRTYASTGNRSEKRKPVFSVELVRWRNR